MEIHIQCYTTVPALITRITGQDRSHLAGLLVSNGCDVHGIVPFVAVEGPDNRFRHHLLSILRLRASRFRLTVLTKLLDMS
jgi:GDP-D-mannose dehydratase